MTQYETDEERLEALKRWWKENGLSVAVGIAIGLGAIFGWRAWQNYQDGQAQAASAVFEQLLARAGGGADPAATLELVEQLQDDYGGTPYAALGSLVAARVNQVNDRPEAAEQALEQVIADAPDPALARIAALRLARLLFARDELDAAAAVVAEHDDKGAFRGECAAIRGDIAAARGDTEAARKAYQEALSVGTDQSRLLEIKLANLPEAG